MKRIVLAGLLVSLVAGTAAAQTAPHSDSQRVILKGISGDSPVVPAAESSLPGNLGTTQENNSDPQKLATCGKCQQEWTNCCCSNCGGWTLLGEVLYLQPRGFDPVFALRGEACAGDSPFPPRGSEQIDFGGEVAFRVGIAKWLCGGNSAIATSWTHFESNDSQGLVAVAPNTLFPLLIFDPDRTCDGATSTLAHASASIDFDRVNVDYRKFIDSGCTKWDWLIGFGYGQLNMDLRANYDDTRFVQVESDSWGYGLRVGGGAETGKSWIRGFGHADLTLLASNVNASYKELQPGLGATSVVANVDREFDRIIPVLDLEVGVAMDLTCHTILKVGYMYSAWFNTVVPTTFVSDVQHGDYLNNISDTLTFDGLFARLEVTW